MILSRGKLLVVTLLFILVAQPVTIWANPSLQQKRTQATQLANEIDAIDNRAELAVEQYNQAQGKLGNLQRQLNETRAKLSKAEADLRAGQAVLNQRVAGIYKSGESVGLLEIVLSAKTLGDFINAVESLKQVSRHDAKLLHRIKGDRLAVEQASRVQAEQEKSQAAVTASLKIKKNDVQRQLGERQAALTKIKDEISRARNAEAAARLTSYVRPRAAAPAAPPRINVPVSGRAGTAVQVALAQLGKPYVWAAAGPNSFDCSGLTMFAFGKVGISLPHSAEAQYGMGQRVSREQLQPGDLIFGGSGGYISHVGIYIGGDQYVTAPRTGDVVKISNLSARRNYVGAVRL